MEKKPKSRSFVFAEQSVSKAPRGMVRIFFLLSNEWSEF